MLSGLYCYLCTVRAVVLRRTDDVSDLKCPLVPPGHNHDQGQVARKCYC